MKKLLFLNVALFFAVSLKAADFDIYGRLGMSAWWMNSSRFYSDYIKDSLGNLVLGEDSVPITYNIMEPYGALGFKFKTSKFAGCIELNAKMNVYDAYLKGTPTQLFGMFKRDYFMKVDRWFAEWYINDYFTFLLGQEYCPTNFYFSNQAFNGCTKPNGVGILNTGSNPMFQLSIHDQNNIVEGKAAVIKVDTAIIYYLNETGYDRTYKCETDLPKLEGSVGLNLVKERLAVNAKAVGGFQKYNSIIFKAQVSADKCKYAINSWVAGGDFGIKVGWAKLSFDVFYGQNLGSYGVKVGQEFGWWNSREANDAMPAFIITDNYMRVFYPVHFGRDSTGTAIDTNTGMPYTLYKDSVVFNSRALELGFALNIKPLDFLSFEIGGGLVRGKHEFEKLDKIWNPEYSGSDKFFKPMYGWYIQSELVLFERLKIVPEVGQFNYGRRLYFGKIFYAGLNSIVEF